MTLYLYWIQVRDLALASMKSRYRKTWAGFIWVILNPLLQFGVQSLVFKRFLKLDIPDYYLFLLGGLLPWIFLTSTLTMSTPVFVQHSHLLRSFKINPLVVLSSQVLDNFLNFIFSLAIILLPFYFVSDRSAFNLVLLPLAVFPLLVATYSMSIMLATLNVFYRDINFVMGFILNLLFFLTPVFYPRNFVPENMRWMIDINPMVYFIEPFRQLLYENSPYGTVISSLYALALALFLIALAGFTWKRKVNDFYRSL